MGIVLELGPRWAGSYSQLIYIHELEQIKVCRVPSMGFFIIWICNWGINLLGVALSIELSSQSRSFITLEY